MTLARACPPAPVGPRRSTSTLHQIVSVGLAEPAGALAPIVRSPPHKQQPIEEGTMDSHDTQQPEQSANHAGSPDSASAERDYGGDDGALEQEGGLLAAPDELPAPERTPADAAQAQQEADLATGRENAS